MIKSRKLYLVGEVSEKAYLDFSMALTELEKNAKKPVELELSSYGGDPSAALAFAGRMRTSPCDIHIRAFGTVASAAVLILAAGDKRVMTKEAWVMVHEASTVIGGKVTHLENVTAQMRRDERQWNALLAELTGTSKTLWAKLHSAKDTYLTAQQCLKLGLVDEVA